MTQLLCILLSYFIFADGYANWAYDLCHKPNFFCLPIKKGDSWDNLFANWQTADIIRRINRTNLPLRAGMSLAIPKDLERLTIDDVSPFPRSVTPTGEKFIYINQAQLAWGAYNEQGELLWWGPISSGIGACNEPGGCYSPVGSFHVIRKQDIECVSNTFPRRKNAINGGAIMPYCMYFFQGYALHGSDTVPGFKASHGCIRLFIEDAQWLNEEFIDIPGGNRLGTRVIIE